MDPNVLGRMSPSKLERFRMCAARAMAMQVDDEFDEDKGEATLVGTLAHEAAKWWYAPNPAWVKAINAATTVVEKHGGQDYRRVTDPQMRFDLFDGREVNTDAGVVLKHPLANPSDAFQMAIKECQQNGEACNEAASIQDAATLFETIVASYPRDRLNVVFAERQYRGNFPNGVPVNTIVDLGVKRSNSRLGIIDYKTGFIPISNNEMWSKDQVLMNLLAVSRDPLILSLGLTETEFCYFWVRTGAESEAVYLPQLRLDDYELWMATKYEWLLSLKPEEAEETINPHCNTCGRRTKCKEFNRMMAEAMGEYAKVDKEIAKGLGDDDILNRTAKVQQQIKVLEESVSVLKGELTARVTKTGSKELKGAQFKALMVTPTLESVSVAKILGLCQEHKVDPADVMTVGSGKVKAIWGKDQAVMADLAASASRRPGTPYVKISPIPAVKTITPAADTDTNAK